MVSGLEAVLVSVDVDLSAVSVVLSLDEAVVGSVDVDISAVSVSIVGLEAVVGSVDVDSLAVVDTGHDGSGSHVEEFEEFRHLIFN